MEAKQALFTARGKVSLEPVNVSEPDENQLLVETLYTAISPGTERAFLMAEPNTITNRSQPGGMAVGIAQTAWECYWTEAIRANDASAERSAQAALTDLVRHHIVVAPPGSPENVAPPAGTKPPFAIYASDGGIRYVKHNYALAAAGDPSGVAQSCRANRGDLQIPPVR